MIEAPFVETLAKRLIKRNLSVIKAYSGLEALEILDENGKVDVVVLDIKMPFMDGIGTLKEIKKRRPSPEVIMLTGHASLESALEGMKYGAFDYLMKPANIDRLITKIFEAGAKGADVAQ